MGLRYATAAAVLLSVAACGNGSSSERNTATTLRPSVMTVSHDNDVDGMVDEQEVHTFDDDVGKVVRIESDRDMDSIYDREIAYTYDQNGYMATEAIDDPLDGIADVQVSFTYDDRGNLTRLARDEDADGIVDYVQTASFNPDNEYLTRSTDFGGDGIFDQVETWVYSATGKVSTYSVDTGGDGADDQIDRFTYDGSDMLVRRDFDAGIDGLLDRSILYSYTSRADGSLLRVSSIDDNGDGNFTRTDRHVWNANEELLELTRDHESDDQYEYEEYWTRNDLDQPLSRRVVIGGSAMITTFRYNAEDNLEEFTIDEDGDGNAERRSEYRYTDWKVGRIF